jgi:predicted RNA-binding protein
MRGMRSLCPNALLIGCVLFFLLTCPQAAPASTRTPDAEFDLHELTLWGEPGTAACGEVGVTNIGDEFLDDICFFTPGGGEVIPLDAFEFDPPCMSLAPGETETLTICVNIPWGIPAGVYAAAVYLEAAEGAVADVLPIEITVECVPALDILDDACDLSGNEMFMSLAVGDSVVGCFVIANIGNCELCDIEGPPPIGPPLVVIPHIPPFCAFGETVEAYVEVRLEEPGLPPGPYQMEFIVTAEGIEGDHFWLGFEIVTAVERESWSGIKARYRSR